MAEEERLAPRGEAEKDAYPPDAQFGRAAAEDAERADELGAAGERRERDEQARPRAGNKAEPEELDPEELDPVDEASAESFPASDPPAHGPA